MVDILSDQGRRNNMQQNTYTCECGGVFTKPNSFNGHKSHCVIHYNSVGKTYSMNDRVEKQKQITIRPIR